MLFPSCINKNGTAEISAAPEKKAQNTTDACPSSPTLSFYLRDSAANAALHLRYSLLSFSRATSILSPHLKHRHLRVLLLRQAQRHSPKNFVCRYFITVSSYTKDLLLSTTFRIFQEMVNLLCKLRRIFHFMHNFLFLFYIDLKSNYAIMNPSQLERVFPKQDTATAG